MVTKFTIVTIQIGIEFLSMGFNTEQSAEWDQKRSVTTHFPGVLQYVEHEQSGHDGVDLAAGEPPQSRFLRDAVQVIRFGRRDRRCRHRLTDGGGRAPDILTVTHQTAHLRQRR